jgi:hypothetical protein
MEKRKIRSIFFTSNQKEKMVLIGFEASWLLTIPLYFPTNTPTPIPFLTNGMYELNVRVEFCGHLKLVAFDKELKICAFSWVKKGFENHWKPNGQPKALSLIKKASLNKMHSTIFLTCF